jgi:DNA-cytosine methyltransferase
MPGNRCQTGLAQNRFLYVVFFVLRSILNFKIKRRLKHIGLFEGIGGFSLAARWMGWETIAWCEWNEYCQKILKQHFKEAQGHGDITKTDFTIYRGQCDIITGGFPCQPYSTAGQRKGKQDERHLWPEMLRAIREIQPRWVIGENVHGIINWGRGLVVKEIKTDLENEGYKLFPPVVLPACAIGAPHQRYRTWFIAHSEQSRWTPTKQDVFKETGNLGKLQLFDSLCNGENTKIERQGFEANWELDIETSICRKDDGLSNWMDRIGALGNAIVPQVAYQLFRVIELMEIEMRNCQTGDEVQCGVGEKIA